MNPYESKENIRDYQFIRALHCVDGQTKGGIGGTWKIEL